MVETGNERITDHGLTAFNRSISHVFTKNQCANASETYNLMCVINQFSSTSGDVEYYLSDYGMSATTCKNICIVNCNFKYAALYS
jgi:hypothetical protein